MKVEVKSNKIKLQLHRTRKLKVDDFIVTEFYVDDKLRSQTWSVKYGFKRTHPTAYETKYMCFDYYDNISFLDSNDCCNYTDFHKQIPDSSFVTNWDEFKGLDHVLSVHLIMDGNIYRIDKPDPISLWRHQDYIGGFKNSNYDLEAVMKILKNKSWIRNVNIVPIPYFNQIDGDTHAVEFDYRLPRKEDLRKKLAKYKLFKSHYFG